MAVTRVSNSVIEDNSINASKLSVSSNGTAGQLLKSNGDGTFSWDSESTYNNVYSIVVGTPPVDLDSIEKIAASINDDAAFYTTITGITGGLQNSIDAIEATDITLTINGDASGTATFTNLGDATLTLTVADDSHNHVISNIDGLQAALDLKASISYVDTSVANLIDSAPGALDTLNELAAALGDDANFAGTVTTALAGKQPIGTYNTIIGTDSDINTSGAIVIDQLNMTDGVIQSHSTRTMTLADLGYTGATNANYITNNNQLTNGAGYTTNVGDITGVTAGSGISGGGTSGTVTVSHADTSSQGSINNSGATVIQDVTLDTYGHITGLGSKTITLADLGYTGATNANYITNNNQLTNGAGYTTNVGDITGVTAGTNLTGGGTSGTVTLNMATGGVGAGTYGSTSDATKIDTITVDAYGRVTAIATGGTGDITGVTAGTNLTGGGSSGAVTLNLDNEISLSRTNLATLNLVGPLSGSMFSDADGLRFGVVPALPSDGRYGDSMLLNYLQDLHVAGDVIAYSSTLSDERLKDNIQTIDGALDKIESLRGVTYIWNSGSREGQKDIGLIAQEVEKVLPEIVREKEMTLIDGETYKTVDYEKIIGVLIESVKELSEKVKTLEAKIQ